jgi:plasmid stability protein
MAQLIVRNLEDTVRDKLRELAERHGRSMEEEVRDILRTTVHARSEPVGSFSDRLADLFADLDVDGPQDDFDGIRGQSPREIDFGPVTP